MYLSPFFKKVLTIAFLIILAGVGFSVWKYFAVSKTNSLSNSVPLSQNNLSTTTPTFDPSLPHISSTTNIIEMFGITKDTKATITKDVVLEWMKDGVATQTLAKIIIPSDVLNITNSKRLPDLKMKNEFIFGNFIIKYQNYFLDIPNDPISEARGIGGGDKLFSKLNSDFGDDNPLPRGSGVITAFNTEKNEYTLLDHELPEVTYNSILSDDAIFIDKQQKLLAVSVGSWTTLSYSIYDKNLEKIIDGSKSPYYPVRPLDQDGKFTIYKSGISDSLYIVSGDGNSVLKIDKKDGYKYVEPKIVYNITANSGSVEISRVENSKIFFQHVSNFKTISEYYYDEATDKVVKIK